MTLQSMTGYASAQSSLVTGSSPSQSLRIGMEMRSVNSRFLDVSFRLPDELRSLEPRLRERILQHLKRGKVECRVQMDRETASSLPLPDAAQLSQWQSIQKHIQQAMPDAAPLSVADVLRLSHSNQAPAWESLSDACLSLAEQCLKELTTFRQREGKQLATDLLARASQLHQLADQALPLVPQAMAAQKEKFLERWREALSMEPHQLLPEVVQERALAEAAAFAIRADVAEEITRLQTHLQEIQHMLKTPTKSEPLGKRLDFLVQELHREANTLGSKSSAMAMTRIALDMKVLIEQMREQVQNLE